MSRQGHRGVMMEGLMVPTKIRKRGCSSTSSSSSRVYNYRLNKRAILVGKNRAGTGIGIGLGRSRSCTPVPTWRTTPLRAAAAAAIESPKHSQGGQSARPVSARRLAATLWEMNETPSPETSESNLEMIKGLNKKKSGSKMVFKREKMQSGWGLHSGLGPLPPHLSDPSHSPSASEKMDRSGTGSRQWRTPSISQRLMSADHIRPIDSISNVSVMESETQSHPPKSSGPAIAPRNRLKDVSNALTTSKELLKIINHIWTRANQPPSSTTPLISALHTELERARLHVNHLIREQRPSTKKDDTDHLIKCLAEEKASWESKQRQAVEAAVGLVSAELESERKLRRRLETLNKKLGKELAETKTSFVMAVKNLDSEKRAREITEEVCDELARNMDNDRAEAEKEREMLELAEKLRGERAQMKLLETKNQFEQKNSAVGKLRRQLEVFLRAKRDEEAIDGRDDPVESDRHSVELNNTDRKSISKGYKWKLPIIDEMKSRRSVSLQRSVSDGDCLDKEGFSEPEVDDPRSSCYFDEKRRHKAIKGLKDHMLAGSRLSSAREKNSLSLVKEQAWPSRDPLGSVIQTSSSKSKTGVVRGEGQSTRRSKW